MKKHYLYAAIAIFGWSTVATVVKLLLGTMNSIQVLSISALFASLFLLVVGLTTGQIKTFKTYIPKDYLISVLISIPGTFFYYVFCYMGTSCMLASQAFIVNYLWPIMSVVFACIILKEKLTLVKAIALLLSFIGVIVTVGNDILAFEWNTLFGAVLCALGAVCYGIFTALNQKFKYEKPNTMMLGFFASFIITSCISIPLYGLPYLNLGQTIGILWNGIVTIGIANTLWQMAIESGDTVKISNLAYITPVLSMVWTSLILKEPISVWSVIGLSIIMLGILIQLWAGKKKLDTLLTYNRFEYSMSRALN